MNSSNKKFSWGPWILPVVLGLWVLSGFRSPSNPARLGTSGEGRKGESMPVQEFGRTPLVFNGRLQPMDSLARNSLLQIREKQSFRVTVRPKQSLWDRKHQVTMSATEWLMEVFFEPEVANGRKVFRVDHPELKGMLGLPLEPDASRGDDGKHYSWNQLSSNLGELDEQARLARKEDPAVRNSFERALIKLHSAMILYMRLQNTVQPMDAADFPEELRGYQNMLPAGTEAFQSRMAGRAFNTNALIRLLETSERYLKMHGFDPPLVVPPAAGEGADGRWIRMGEALLKPFASPSLVRYLVGSEELPANEVRALMDQVGQHTMSPAVSLYAEMASAWRARDASRLSSVLREYHELLQTGQPQALKKVAREQRFNQFAPFYKSLSLYVIAFVMVGVFWTSLKEPVRKSAMYVIFLALIIHSGGILMRMLLEGRPPVTNLYSSAVFIGWGAVGLGLILEGFWRNAVGSAVAAMVGFATLIVAHHLAMAGDTMEMMQAVLDTNFWLATHVVIVTLGYASTYVAGFLSILFIVLGIFTPMLNQDLRRSLSRMVYGIICFATLFSFVGTVLGGIWADQSWGRFWGWDPKENGALIIVLWNAMILHARWGGLIRDRGLHVLSVGGNIITSWSWFGTNMLGIGLHSYGFMDAAFYALIGFVSFNLLIMAMAFVPQSLWRSTVARPA